MFSWPWPVLRLWWGSQTQSTGIGRTTYTKYIFLRIYYSPPKNAHIVVICLHSNERYMPGTWSLWFHMKGIMIPICNVRHDACPKQWTCVWHACKGYRLVTILLAAYKHDSVIANLLDPLWSCVRYDAILWSDISSNYSFVSYIVLVFYLHLGWSPC